METSALDESKIYYVYDTTSGECIYVANEKESKLYFYDFENPNEAKLYMTIKK